jgi:CubicO group peptidase (beta-lactamase class C family)
MEENKIKCVMKKNVYVLLSCLFSAYGAFAQVSPDNQLTKSVDSLVSPQFEGNQPGISILIAKKGQIVYEKAFGSANMELNTAMRPDMVFRIGSITKQFTAIAILQLVEQGKISLQDSIQRYVKDFPSKGTTITIENLLTHTSGIVDYTSKDDPDPYIERRDFTPEFLINYIKNDPLQFKPGFKYAYSNSNYLLLGYIVQLVSGESYHQYMADNVIKPAGLTHTLYAEERTIVPGRVTGYTRFSGFFENADYQTLSLGFAAGDLLSSVEDLYKWNSALLTGRLVKKETLQKAYTPFKLNSGSYSNYGYGWFIDNTDGSKCIHHEGQVSGFIAMERYYPDKDVYATILTNVKTADDKTDFSDNRFRLFENIFSLVLGQQLGKEVKVNDKTLSDYVGTYEAHAQVKHAGSGKITNEVEYLYIRIEDKKLYSALSNGTGKNMYLSPQSETMFVLPDVKRIHTTIEFISNNGQVTGLYWTQEKKIEFKKIK